ASIRGDRLRFARLQWWVRGRGKTRTLVARRHRMSRPMPSPLPAMTGQAEDESSGAEDNLPVQRHTAHVKFRQAACERRLALRTRLHEPDCQFAGQLGSELPPYAITGGFASDDEDSITSLMEERSDLGFQARRRRQAIALTIEKLGPIDQSLGIGSRDLAHPVADRDKGHHSKFTYQIDERGLYRADQLRFIGRDAGRTVLGPRRTIRRRASPGIFVRSQNVRPIGGKPTLDLLRARIVGRKYEGDPGVRTPHLILKNAGLRVTLQKAVECRREFTPRTTSDG